MSADRIIQPLLGKKFIRFMNGSTVKATIERVIVTPEGEPIMLLSMDGSVYPWRNIQGVQVRMTGE